MVFTFSVVYAICWEDIFDECLLNMSKCISNLLVFVIFLLRDSNNDWACKVILQVQLSLEKLVKLVVGHLIGDAVDVGVHRLYDPRQCPFALFVVLERLHKLWYGARPDVYLVHLIWNIS